MMCIKFHFLVSAVILLASTGCAETGADFAGMRASEKKFNERQRQEVVSLMSLKTMFPNHQVQALAKAAGKGDVKKIDKLVAEGVDVNARGTQGATPLYWALHSYKGFKRLLELGADPNVVFNDGGDIMNGMFTRPGSYRFDQNILKIALEHGGNPNLVSRLGSHETPIFKALRLGTFSSAMDAVDILLVAGADINATDEFGYTPVISAASAGRYDYALALLQRGADYKTEDKTHGGMLLANQIGWSRSMISPQSKESAHLDAIVVWLESRGVKIPVSGWWTKQ